MKTNKKMSILCAISIAFSPFIVVLGEGILSMLDQFIFIRYMYISIVETPYWVRVTAWIIATIFLYVAMNKENLQSNISK